jgi:hypothetical protein
MRLFIRKYELRKLILGEHQFHDRNITLLYIWQQLCDITITYGTKFKIYAFKLLNANLIKS